MKLNKRKTWIGTFFFAIILTACGTQNSQPIERIDNLQPQASNTLRVTIKGATTSVPAIPGIEIINTRGQVIKRITHSTTVVLAAGEYRVIAPDWIAGIPGKPGWREYYASVSPGTVRLPSTNGASVTVTYYVDYFDFPSVND